MRRPARPRTSGAVSMTRSICEYARRMASPYRSPLRPVNRRRCRALSALAQSRGFLPLMADEQDTTPARKARLLAHLQEVARERDPDRAPAGHAYVADYIRRVLGG